MFLDEKNNLTPINLHSTHYRFTNIKVQIHKYKNIVNHNTQVDTSD